MLTGQHAIDLTKTLKHLGQILSGDANSSIANFEQEFTCLFLDQDTYSAICVRELYGIRQQIQNDLHDAPLITEDQRKIGGNFGQDVYMGLFGLKGHHSTGLRDYVPKGDALLDKMSLSRIDS